MTACAVAAAITPGAAHADQGGLASRAAAAPGTAVGEWDLADALSARVQPDWRPSVGAYGGANVPSIRVNAMLLELHAYAALEGHVGPSRQDAHAQAMARFFSSPPVLVLKTRTKRAPGQFPHTPAFEGAYTRFSGRAALHPSSDGVVARALAIVWEARDQLGLDAATRLQIQTAIGGVALGDFYRSGGRAENQINWNADVDIADWEINGRESSLERYRAELLWLAKYANVSAFKHGSSNFSPGGALRYSPQNNLTFPINRYGAVEYANLIHGALGYYGRARSDGMRPLPSWAKARLERWSGQIAYGTWTQAGYLNWDTGLGDKRRHLRQYWGLALESLVRSAEPGGLVANAGQRGFIKLVARRGVELFDRTAWNGTGPLPGPTSFMAHNGFPEATGIPLIAPLRFAVAAILSHELLGDVQESDPGLLVSDDEGVSRLAVTGDDYNLAVVRSGPWPEGGLEPTRLFDGRQRPLTTLGASGFAGPSPGLRLTASTKKVLADTQPGTGHGPTAWLNVGASARNKSTSYHAFTASGTTGKGARVTVTQRFTNEDIHTTYAIRPGAATSALMRMPLWGRDSTWTFSGGVERESGGNYARTTGTIIANGTTEAGATMIVQFTGIPSKAQISLVHATPTPRAPVGALQIEIRYAAHATTRIGRTISFPDPQ